MRAGCIVALFCALSGGSAMADLREAARQVRQGIEHHRGGNFSAAEEAFAAAGKLLPDDARIVYDRACALAAQGKLEAAEELFLQARLAQDAGVVAASHYNLGRLEAERAKAGLGVEPENAEPEQRKAAIEHVTKAVAYFRDCLRVDPEYLPARHNLEVLRLWVKHIQDVWRHRDREKQRESLGLLEFLEMIQSEQRQLRSGVRLLAGADDSPRRRQMSVVSGQAQRELADEIPHLQRKIRESLQPPDPAGTSSPAPPPPPPAAPDPRVAEAIEALAVTAGQARSHMSQAAIELTTNSPQQALASQLHAIDVLNEVYRAVAPFEHVLRKSIAVESQLVELTRVAEDAAPTASPAEPAPGLQDAAHEQRLVAGWVETLPEKARQHVEAAAASATAPSANPPSSTNANPPTDTRPPPTDVLAKTQELAPKARAAAAEAASHLDKKDWNLALPKQEEALKLLKELAESVPPPPQDQQGEKDKNENPEQGNKNEQSNSSDPDPAQREKPEDSKSSDADQKSSPQRDLSRQQMEALLRQARERERDYKEQKRRIESALRGGIKVDKDW
jgi:hypothetical protein